MHVYNSAIWLLKTQEMHATKYMCRLEILAAHFVYLNPVKHMHVYMYAHAHIYLYMCTCTCIYMRTRVPITQLLPLHLPPSPPPLPSQNDPGSDSSDGTDGRYFKSYLKARVFCQRRVPTVPSVSTPVLGAIDYQYDVMSELPIAMASGMGVYRRVWYSTRQ